MKRGPYMDKLRAASGTANKIYLLTTTAYIMVVPHIPERTVIRFRMFLQTPAIPNSLRNTYAD